MQNRWPALDIFKFLFAILLVCAHYASEYGNFPSVIDMLFSLYIVTVPFYFACSSFLYFIKNHSIIEYEKRILKMYLGWSLVYFVFVLLDWMMNGTVLTEVITYFHKSLVYTTYSTIWFLPALAIGIAIVYNLSKILTLRQMIILASGCYAICALGKSYSFIIENSSFNQVLSTYNNLFFTTRNGLFNAFPFCLIGYIVAKEHQKQKSRQFIRNMTLSVIFLVAIVAESFILKFVFHNSDENTIIMLIPFTYFFLKTLLDIKVKQRDIYLVFRKLSTYIFTSQRIWLSGVPTISVGFYGLISYSSWGGMAIVIILTLVISIALMFISKKSRLISCLG